MDSDENGRCVQECHQAEASERAEELSIPYRIAFLLHCTLKKREVVPSHDSHFACDRDNHLLYLASGSMLFAPFCASSLMLATC